MGELVRQTLWDAELARSEHFDKILIQNLEVTVNAGKDVWGRKKKQRAFISVTVTLDTTFASASSTDSVDNSTIHYGILSKAIQAELADKDDGWMSTAQLSWNIAVSIGKVAGSTGVHAIETDVRYLKGSMFGDGAGLTMASIGTSGLYSSVLYLRNVLIPCLIGVNPNERLQKQPVVLNIWIECLDKSRVDDYTQLETLLFEVSSKLLLAGTRSLYDLANFRHRLSDHREHARMDSQAAQRAVLHPSQRQVLVDQASN